MPQETEIQKLPAQPTVSPTASTTLPTTQLFDQALVFQQAQNWDASLEAYQKLLDQSTGEMSNLQASVVYHNMSTSAFEKGDVLKAYIWSKKALWLNPKNQSAQDSYSHYSKKVEIPVIAHQITNQDYFRSGITKVPLDAWLTISLIFSLVTLWLFFKNILIIKKNILENNFAAQKKWPIFVVLFITFVMLSASYVSYQDSYTMRALVIAEKAQVQTAPGENKPVIFELQTGQELEVLRFDQGYFQVRYPGAFSGWIKKTQLEILSLTFGQ